MLLPRAAWYHAGQEIESLWQEYEDGKSPEALMVKDFDKVLFLTSCRCCGYLTFNSWCMTMTRDIHRACSIDV